MLLLLQIFAFIVVADMLWFRYSYPKFYRRMYSKINGNSTQKSGKHRILSALASWMILAIGIWYFGVVTSKGSLDSLLRGAMLGGVVYGVSNTASYTTINRFRLKTALIDIAWGVALCAFTALFFRLVYRPSSAELDPIGMRATGIGSFII